MFICKTMKPLLFSKHTHTFLITMMAVLITMMAVLITMMTVLITIMAVLITMMTVLITKTMTTTMITMLAYIAHVQSGSSNNNNICNVFRSLAFTGSNLKELCQTIRKPYISISMFL